MVFPRLLLAIPMALAFSNLVNKSRASVKVVYAFDRSPEKNVRV
eukprot:CAMPEP_0116853378 /NCGR_PEP_ID=MMETSP0418-20121206/17878_1 /TAXON_ID=1158023 /ORGANISM="Astrosyne radiata, Strain 13vi08-1A" /LENGTH=43 /DNA_ID= /DNA_START= /DNA_END= /DNA_ORIENTATION=